MSGARTRALLALSVAAALLSGAAATVPALAITAIAAVTFDHYDLSLTVLQFVFTAIASVMVRLGLSIVARVAGGSAALLVSRDERAAAARALGALPLGDLAAARPGAFETLLLDDVDAVAAFVAERVPEIAAACGTLVTAWAVLFIFDRSVATFALAFALVAVALAALAGVRGPTRDEELNARDALGATIFSAARTTDLDRSLPDAGIPQRSVPELARAYRAAVGRRIARVIPQNALRRAFAGAFPAVLVLTALALGGTHARLTLLILFAALGLRMTSAWTVAFGAAATSAPARAARKRIAALLARRPMESGATAFPVGSDVRFRDVSFAYPAAGGGRGEVLHGIDVFVPAGTVTAIVGPSGSGKTTFTRLAARFWDVDRGSVEIGGVDVRAVPLDTLMRGIACVFQDVALLDDTVAVNLRLGRPDASDEDLARAAEAAGAGGFIAALPNGYDTVIGDRGMRLSRGERQRLQIARAFLKDAPIVILDEPTASMDPLTEAAIADALVPLLRGKTVIVVAHRLSTVVEADRIVVLDRTGRVEAQGTHGELLAASPTYADMWTAYAGSNVPATQGALP